MPRLSSESCARMVEGISRVLDDQNYQLLLINTANDNTREVRALDTLRHDTVDGIILIAPCLPRNTTRCCKACMCRW